MVIARSVRVFKNITYTTANLSMFDIIHGVCVHYVLKMKMVVIVEMIILRWTVHGMVILIVMLNLLIVKRKTH